MRHVGSGDSTIPLLRSRKKVSKTDVVISNPMPERSFRLMTYKSITLNPTILSNHCRQTHASRLAALSFGYDAKSPPFLDDSTITDSETSTTHSASKSDIHTAYTPHRSGLQGDSSDSALSLTRGSMHRWAPPPGTRPSCA